MSEKQEPYIEDAVERLIGKRCRIETHDGSVRYEKINSVRFMPIEFGKDAVAKFPFTLFFDSGEVDGVELNIVRSIEVLPE